jgi:hypothetical protein
MVAHDRDRERFDALLVDGKYYVHRNSEAHDTQRGFSTWHEAHSAWRSDRDIDDSEPLAFDNNDYGRIYDSVVESDYSGRLESEYREYREMYGSGAERLELYDPVPYDEDTYAEWRKEEYGVDWIKDVFPRRGEFRGGY